MYRGEGEHTVQTWEHGVIKAAIKIISLCKGFSGLIELLTGTVKCDGDVIDKIWPYLSVWNPEQRCILFQGRLILTPVSLHVWNYQENWKKSSEKLQCLDFKFCKQRFGLLICSDIWLLSLPVSIIEASSVLRVMKVTHVMASLTNIRRMLS